MEKDKLVKMIETYLWQITAANDCFEVYKTLQNATQTRLDELNLAPAFFSVVNRSLFNDFMMITARLFDKNDDSMVSVKQTMT